MCFRRLRRAVDGGIYTLELALESTVTVTVGALGQREFEAGRYAYVGSALGSGGFARVERHRELAAGERDVRHWHVDALLCRPETSLRAVRTSRGVDGECRLAALLGGTPVPGFGCSDCGCDTHLFRWDSPERARADLDGAHERLERAD
jgi:Uri superfamily endonuclease